ncbi:wax ester/triacylglycerol synthase domain-containing protein [Subtercola endophyticus]|uniref:wax ester/triacylglycerol synthase domain-containing protein n=1 Tax=Subtercola endophyticus TaxID=2895559 RepID=UPI001E521CCB|nr:wax ester/triacylglycerol synthase domain-containing protein [Subtercola endophyticus]UFS59676.1 WS/DGAT domain-containing protein [Subtercola endophyticus]
MTEQSQRLSPDDARILALESATLTGHTLKLMILEPGSPVDLEALRKRVSERLVDQPRARERVATAADDGTSIDPRWVPAEQFDIADHVRRHSGTECATRADLRRAVSALMSQHLPRDRPLWTLDLIGPLADGTEAIAARMHHAMVDGIAGMRFLDAILFDPHDVPMHAVGTRATSIRSTGGDEWLRMPGAAWRELAHPGGRSPFDKPITVARDLAFVSTPLDELKAIGASRPAHATVNDVLLAVVAGGLHRWLGSRHRARYVRAQVPVSLHHRDEDAADSGNHDSFINVDLPLSEPDPLRRLDHISSQTRTEKQLDDASLLYDLFHALGRVAPADELVHRIAGSPREFSVAISNVPGPRVPVAVAGRRIDELFTSSEPATHHALRISAISNATAVGIGFCTDPTALPGISDLADDAGAAYAELRTAALSR